MKFNVPKLVEIGAWVDNTDPAKGGANWRGLRDLKKVSQVVIHHSVTEPQWDWQKDLEVIRRVHMDSNKWAGIGYSFIITSARVGDYAVVIQNGTVDSIRAHTINKKGYRMPANEGNVYGIGICVIGKWHESPRPYTYQLNSLKLLVEELLYKEDTRLPLLVDWSNVSGHKDHDYTACPGNITTNMIADWKFVSWADSPDNNDPCEKLKSQIEELEKSNEKLENDYQKLLESSENVLNKIKKELDESNAIKFGLEKKVSLLELEVKKTSTDFADLKRANEEYANILKERGKTIEKLQEKLKNLRSLDTATNRELVEEIIERLSDWVKLSKAE